MPVVSVRPATAADAPTIRAFAVALATFEREPDAVTATVEDLVRDGFGLQPQFGALIAEVDGAAAGFALYTWNYSMWEGRRGIFVEDIWVEEAARRHGVGRALMAALARECCARGWGRIDLNVLDWNPARDFYERLGLAHISDWLPYRVRGAALARLAGE